MDAVSVHKRDSTRNMLRKLFILNCTLNNRGTIKGLIGNRQIMLFILAGHQQLII